MKKELLKFSAAALLALMLVPQVQAASVSVTMTETAVDDLLPDGWDYLSVTVSDGVDGAIDFSVEILPTLLDINSGSNFGIEDFVLNIGSSAVTLANLVLPEGWFARQYTPPGQYAEFGDFDLLLKGGPDSRQQSLEFSIVGVEGDTIFDYVSELSSGLAEQGNVLFAANLEGFELNLEALANSDLPGTLDPEQIIPTNGKFGGSTSVVPLPPAVALSLSALAMLGLTGLRRRKLQA